MGIYANIKIIQEKREEIYEDIDKAIKSWLRGFKVELNEEIYSQLRNVFEKEILEKDGNYWKFRYIFRELFGGLSKYHLVISNASNLYSPIIFAGSLGL